MWKCLNVGNRTPPHHLPPGCGPGRRRFLRRVQNNPGSQACLSLSLRNFSLQRKQKPHLSGRCGMSGLPEDISPWRVLLLILPLSLWQDSSHHRLLFSILVERTSGWLQLLLSPLEWVNQARKQVLPICLLTSVLHSGSRETDILPGYIWDAPACVAELRQTQVGK